MVRYYRKKRYAPARRRYRAGRRNFRRRNNRRGRGRVMALKKRFPLNGFKYFAPARFNWSQTGTLDTTTGQGGSFYVANHVFKVTSPFDHDHTGTGHQPIGWDQMIANYDFCLVVGAKCTLRMCNPDPTVQVMCGMQLQKDSLFNLGGINPYIGIPNAKYRVMQFSESDGDAKNISLNFSPKRFWGKTVATLKNQSADFGCTSAANPLHPCYLLIWAWPTNDAATTADVPFQVTIETSCIFYNKDVPADA